MKPAHLIERNKAIHAARAAGRSLSSLAREHGISPATIRGIVRVVERRRVWMVYDPLDTAEVNALGLAFGPCWPDAVGAAAHARAVLAHGRLRLDDLYNIGPKRAERIWAWAERTVEAVT